MAELGKIEKPEIKSFRGKRKLYLVPILPFEELAEQFKLDNVKIEQFWKEVREKIDYFISVYGKISVIYIEGIREEEKVGIEFFEKYGKDSSHYMLIKTLLDSGAVVKGIEKEECLRRSKLLFEEYSKSFLPEVKEIHEGFFGKDMDFDGWREYLVKKIQGTQDEMSRFASKTIEGSIGEGENGILIITDGRQIEFPDGFDVFQIRPPSFDEIARNVRENI